MKTKRRSTMRNYIGAVLFMLFLNACAMLGWPTVRQKQILSVRAGMTEQNVLALCGEPQDRRIHQGQEEWYYYVSSGMETMNYYIVFEQGKVASLSRKSLEQRRREALGIDRRPPVVVQPTLPPAVPVPHYPQTPPRDYPPVVLSNQLERSFEEFYRSVERENFDSDRYERMREAVKYRPFTCHHLVRLMRLFNFDSERIKVVEILAPAVIDKQNAHAIGEVFDFGNYRSQAIQMIIDKAPQDAPIYYPRGAYGCTIQELDADFEAFYRSVRGEAFESDKWKRIREAAKYRYFTCKHCLRMMDMFAFESDRLKVLQILAPAIIDPENAYQVADRYTFRSDKERVIRIITEGRAQRVNKSRK